MELVEIFPFDSPADAERIVRIHNVYRKERLPFLVDATAAEYVAKNDEPNITFRHFVLPGDDGGDVAMVTTAVWKDGTNPNLVWAQLGVHPDHRRRGIGRLLVRKIHDVAVESGRTTIEAGGTSTVPAAKAFAGRIGADAALTEHVNVADVREIDRSMLASWRDEGPHRAPDYDVLIYEDIIPEEHYAGIAGLFMMADQDMPLGDLEYEPQAETAETVRQRLEQAADHVERVTVLAQHRTSGSLVAFSEIVVVGGNSETLQTTLTVVDRDHRGHALGKWIKAEAVLRSLDRYPDAIRIVTENAVSNTPMLGINTLIGFRPTYEVVDYQVSVEQLGKYLGA